MTKRILFVENEKNLARFVTLELQQADFQVVISETGKDALKLAKESDYDLILLNFSLVDMSSQHFAEELSRFKPASVIIVLMSPEQMKDENEVAQTFAVSQLVKPFIISDLVEKISAIFRGRDFIDQHCSQMKVPTSYRDLRLDVENHLVYRGQEIVSLTRREYDLLATLMSSKKVLTREQLLERVWKYESATETNVVDVYIRYIRGKIDIKGQPSYIKTVRGVGYQMQD
ncbi:Response regulator CsrR [Streptococcus sp. DD10]|uniref:response regulator transcription factor n=1 Tax=Streptococcus sp. DD10 TaxID=1777878 RepID=UPI000792CB7D|nr:response regulator transcription factor [Streptococcus sp. DD10]KXT73785.1 Response regulator CsrR [Streptococcus sp. DD10]